MLAASLAQLGHPFPGSAGDRRLGAVLFDIVNIKRRLGPGWAGRLVTPWRTLSAPPPPRPPVYSTSTVSRIEGWMPQKASKVPASGKADRHALLRLLGAGVEVELGMENAHVVGARVVVEHGQRLPGLEANVGRRERLAELADDRGVLGRRRARRLAAADPRLGARAAAASRWRGIRGTPRGRPAPRRSAAGSPAGPCCAWAAPRRRSRSGAPRPPGSPASRRACRARSRRARAASAS